jgi:hypothetical protein
MSRALLIFCAGASALSLFGFGCRPPSTNGPSFFTWQIPWLEQVTQTSGPSSTTTYPTVPYLSDGRLMPQIIRRINTSMEAFREQKSFRADIIVPGPNGALSGTLDFSRESGMRGDLHLPGPSTVQLIALSTAFYVKTDGEDWRNIQNTSEAQQMRRSLDAALSRDGSATSTTDLPDTTKILEIATDPDHCTRILYRQPESEDLDATTSICLRDGLPVHISASTPYGRIETRYRDYGIPLVIQVPSVR